MAATMDRKTHKIGNTVCAKKCAAACKPVFARNNFVILDKIIGGQCALQGALEYFEFGSCELHGDHGRNISVEAFKRKKRPRTLGRVAANLGEPTRITKETNIHPNSRLQGGMIPVHLSDP